MIALDILRNCPDKKTSDEMRRLFELAKEDIVFIADLSWELSRGVRWNHEKNGTKVIPKVKLL